MGDSDVIEQAARVLSRAWGNMATNDSLGRQRMLACALADAGLLARPMDKIALDRLQELAEARGHNRGFHLGWDAALDFTKGKNQ